MDATSSTTGRHMRILSHELKEMAPPRPLPPRERITALFIQHATAGNLSGIKTALEDKDAGLLTPDAFGDALQKASEGGHLQVVGFLLDPEKVGKLAPSILGVSAVILVKHPEAAPTMELILAAPRFPEVSSQDRVKMVTDALDADNLAMIDYLIHSAKFAEKISPAGLNMILNKMAQNKKGGYVKEFLKLFNTPPHDLNLFEAAKLAAADKCLGSFIEIIASSDNANTIPRDMMPLQGQIDGIALKDKVSKKVLGALFIACVHIGDLILPLGQFDAISEDDLKCAFEGLKSSFIKMLKSNQKEAASKIACSQAFAEIPTADLTGVFEETREIIFKNPSMIMILCLLLTPKRLAEISPPVLGLFLLTVCEHAPSEAPEDEAFEPLFRKLFDKVVSSKQFINVPPKTLQTSFATALRNNKALIQDFFTCGRFQEITTDNLFTIFKELPPIQRKSFSGITLSYTPAPFNKDQNVASPKEIFDVLSFFGILVVKCKDSLDTLKPLLIKDARLIHKVLYPIFPLIDLPFFVSCLDQLFIKDKDSRLLREILLAAAGLGLPHTVHAIYPSRSRKLDLSFLEYAALYSASGNQMMVVFNGQPFFFDPEKNCPLNLKGKAAVLREIVCGPHSDQLELPWIKRMISLAAGRGDHSIVSIILESPRIKSLPADERSNLLAEAQKEAEKNGHQNFARALAIGANGQEEKS